MADDKPIDCMLELLLLLEKFARAQYLNTFIRMRISFIPALLHSGKHTFMSTLGLFGRLPVRQAAGRWREMHTHSYMSLM